jgi:hypothetical protein
MLTKIMVQSLIMTPAPPNSPNNFSGIIENKGQLQRSTPMPRSTSSGQIPLDLLEVFRATPTSVAESPLIQRNLSASQGQGKKSSDASPLPPSSSGQETPCSPTSKSARNATQPTPLSNTASPSKSASKSLPPRVAADEEIRVLSQHLFGPSPSSGAQSRPSANPRPSPVFYTQVDSGSDHD